MKPSQDISKPSKIPLLLPGDSLTILDRDRANSIIQTANKILSMRSVGPLVLLHAKAGIRITLQQ